MARVCLPVLLGRLARRLLLVSGSRLLTGCRLLLPVLLMGRLLLLVPRRLDAR